MRVKLVAWAFGAAFGFMISLGHFTDPDEIRQMLLLENLYLSKMFVLAVAQRLRSKSTSTPVAPATGI